MDPYFLELNAVKAIMGIMIGMILGSFTTMLSYRLPRGISIVTPRSTCPSCHTVLGITDLIPLFSWLFNKGRCRHCHAKIGARYILIELATTVFTTLAFILIGFTIWLLPALLFIIALMTLVTMRLER